jgi:hypothetical protein
MHVGRLAKDDPGTEGSIAFDESVVEPEFQGEVVATPCGTPATTWRMLPPGYVGDEASLVLGSGADELRSLLNSL